MRVPMQLGRGNSLRFFTVGLTHHLHTHAHRCLVMAVTCIRPVSILEGLRSVLHWDGLREFP